MTEAPFLPQEVIRAKRDGGALAPAAIAQFIAGVTDGRVSDAQIAGFTMATLLCGMTREECVALTVAMRDSGQRLDWRRQGIDRPVLDKHSTGGVGDGVSLALAPLLAACGAAVPMISGRGLGHTGGTLDKLDAIPGYVTRPDTATFVRVVAQVGCAIVGASADLAPADARIYAVRDVTATVESIPLIAASILSKKLAAGLDALVMDVKVGNGAFMPTAESATELARTIAQVGSGAGVPTTALLTDMSQPLGSAAGNALEVAAAIDYLTGRDRPERFHAVVMALAREALLLGGLAGDAGSADQRLQQALASGAAAALFARMASALGGPNDLLEAPHRHLAKAPVQRAIAAPAAGHVAAIDTRRLGVGVVMLGGGRTRAEDAVDLSVGLADIAPLGTRVQPGDPLAIIHAASAERAAAVAAELVTAWRIEPTAPALPPLIHARLTA